MAWFAIYFSDSGELVSQGSVVTDPLPPNLASLEFPERPLNVVWNPSTLSFDPKPPRPPKVDRLDDLQTNSVLVGIWSKLNGSERNELRSVLGELLGPRWRFRHAEDDWRLSI